MGGTDTLSLSGQAPLESASTTASALHETTLAIGDCQNALAQVAHAVLELRTAFADLGDRVSVCEQILGEVTRSSGNSCHADFAEGAHGLAEAAREVASPALGH